MLTRFVLRRVAAAIVVLFAITYVAYFTQDMAMRQRLLQPAPIGEVAQTAWGQTITLWEGIPRGDWGEYTRTTGYMLRQGERAPLAQLVGTSLWNSSVLLLLAMALGGVVGGLLGIAFAAIRRRAASLSMLLLSVVGVSTPSFFLAVLLQLGAIEFYKRTGVRLVPVGGFGWDSHLVLPVLVLAARPIAQVARLTSVYMENLIGEDFVRTARAKGLPNSEIWFGHILPNAAGTVLTAIVSSLRFALSSLPVVEVFFGWPGLGKHLLERLQGYDLNAASALVLATGFFFVLVNGLMDLAYRVLDPRLRRAQEAGSAQMEISNWLELAWTGFVRAITLRGLRERRKKAQELAPLPVDTRITEESKQEMSRLAESMRWGRLRAWRKATVGNPALALGAVLGIALLAMVLAGPQLAPHNPYTTASRVEIEGITYTPPFRPSDLFPLGSDAQGRDILSLLLAGARRTMMLALLAVAGRLVIGGVFGFLAGWFHDTLLDRALMALGEMVNSFPALLLATLVVYATGIRQGLYAFVFGLLVIGWPEVMQNIRAQVISVRPMAYIEGAVATGAGQGQILTRHVLPNIWPTMVSLAFLEMGGALMILGELGFLGVFIGGGFAAEGEGGPPLLTYYDIPEWGVMLANSWRSFRSFPWATVYPALAFMIAIVAFTLLGEGLRRMSEELTLSMKTLFNRYTLLAAVVILGVGMWTAQSTGIWARYKPLAETFDAGRAMADVQTLAGPEFGGRQIGTPGAEAAADWIARQFEDLGLVTAGEDWTCFQTIHSRVVALQGQTTLEAWDALGKPVALTMGRDFAEATELLSRQAREADGEIVYVAMRADSPSTNLSAVRAALGFSEADATRTDRILLLDHADQWLTTYPWFYGPGSSLAYVGAQAALVITDDPSVMLRRELPGTSIPGAGLTARPMPVLYITPEAADRILSGSGYNLAALRDRRASLADGEGFHVATSARARAQFAPVEQQDIAYRNVMAMWPGEDVALDSEMVVILAYYDGLGAVNGVLYPGANDNASGVATMLEIIRSWKAWDFKPKRTVLFVAWAGGELHQTPALYQYLGTRSGLSDLKVVAVFQVEGVGAGDGEAVLAWRSSSDRMTEMVQTGARRLGIPLKTAGMGLHAPFYLSQRLQTNYPMITLSWPGADAYSHLPGDGPEGLDPAKIGRAGRLLSLTAAVLATDTAY
ncbi:MAG: hypothetical protein Kow00123_21470 [Anaerolineales bacterium]